MSHFLVLVVGKDAELQLAPYQENNMSDCPKKYLEFIDKEDELLEEYQTGTRTMVKLGDGSFVSPWDDRFKNPKAHPLGLGEEPERIIPDHLHEEEVPFSALYASFEEFVEDYHGYEKDPEKERYGYWANPDAKWDWYMLGGRWAGYFKLKNGSLGQAGQPGIMTAPARKGYSDSALVRNIDFEGMRSEAGDRAKESYERLERLLGGAIPKLDLLWQDLIEGEAYKEMPIEKKRALYHNQPAKLAVVEARKREDLGEEDKSALAWVDLEEYQCPKDEYVQRARNSAVTTFAVIMDGKWYERGSMGWWGIVSDQKEVDQWNEEFHKLLDGLPEDTLISVYDCHI